MNLNEAIKILDGAIPPPENKMVDLERLDIAIAWREVKAGLGAQNDKLRAIHLWLTYAFEMPCAYSFGGEEVKDYVDARAPGWCEENCDNENVAACWEKFFDLKFEEKEHKDNTEPPKPLSCEFCGYKMVWENPHIPGHWHESSGYLGDGWPICIDCMATHCESANCVNCKYGAYPDCQFYYLHRKYDCPDETENAEIS